MDAPGFWPLAALRLAAWCGLGGIIAAAAWELVVDRETAASSTARGWALVSAIVLLLTRPAQLYVQTWVFFGPDGAVDLESMRTIALETTWGTGWSAQLMVAIAAVVATVWWRWGDSLGGWVLGIVALVGAFVEPMTGHAADRGFGSLPHLLLAAHVTGAGAWIGGLALLVRRSRAVADHRAFAERVDRFSFLARTAAATITVTGGWVAWLYLESVSDLWSTGWGRALLAKLGLLAVVLWLGYRNWRRLGPALGAPEATRRLGRSASLELAFALALIAVTSVLVALHLPAG